MWLSIWRVCVWYAWYSMRRDIIFVFCTQIAKGRRLTTCEQHNKRQEVDRYTCVDCIRGCLSLWTCTTTVWFATLFVVVVHVGTIVSATRQIRVSLFSIRISREAANWIDGVYMWIEHVEMENDTLFCTNFSIFFLLSLSTCSEAVRMCARNSASARAILMLIT